MSEGPIKTVQVPSVGRVVHYIAYGTPGGEFPAGVRRAAIVTEVDEPGNPDSAIGVCVLNPTGMFFNRHIRRTLALEPGCWTWPDYVPPVPLPPLEEVALKGAPPGGFPALTDL